MIFKWYKNVFPWVNWQQDRIDWGNGLATNMLQAIALNEEHTFM